MASIAGINNYGIKVSSHNFPQAVAQSPMLISPAGSQRTPFSTGWSMAYATMTANIDHFQSGTVFANKSAEIRALLTAMNRESTHFGTSIYYSRLTLPSGREGTHAAPYHQVRLHDNGVTTTAAWVKLESGNMPTGGWCQGYNTSQGGWQLCGYNYTGGAGGYTHNHPNGHPSGSTCSILVALPGTVAGYVDLTQPRSWFTFSNLDGGRGQYGIQYTRHLQ